jgi:hypothetical protein
MLLMAVGLKLLFTADCMLTRGQLYLEQGLGHRDKLFQFLFLTVEMKEVTAPVIILC